MKQSSNVINTINFNNKNLILTLDEILSHDDDLLYYSIWSLCTTAKQEINIAAPLAVKQAYIEHSPRVASLGSKLSRIVPVQTYTWRKYLPRYEDKLKELKQAEQLVVIDGDLVLKVVQTIVNSGAPSRSWTLYFRIWCYIYCIVIGEGEHQVSQLKTSKILSMRYETTCRIFLDLLNMGVIDRKGSYHFGVNGSHSYTYSIPQITEKN